MAWERAPWLHDDNRNPSAQLPTRPSIILFGWYEQLGGLPWLPTWLFYVSSDAQEIQPRPIPMTPCPDRPVSSLVGTKLCPLPLPTRIHTDSSMKSDCDWEHWWLQRHSVSFACTFGERSTWWQNLDSLMNKRLPVKSTSLFGMMEMDQGEANVCIWQDTHKAKEVPFKKE